MKIYVHPELFELSCKYADKKLKEIDSLRELINSVSFDQLKIYAHNLAGNAPSYGLDLLGDIALTIEKDCKDKKKDNLNQYVNQIENYLKTVEIVPKKGPITHSLTSENKLKYPSKLKILVVDDDEFSLKIFKTLIKNSRYVIETLNNSLEAIDKIKNNNYQLVFIDLVMPNKNGYELATEIKKTMPQNLSVLIALSATSKAEISNNSLNTFDFFITKPINKIKFESVITSYLNSLPS